MGYTHYWGIDDESMVEVNVLEKRYRKAVLECSKFVKAYNDRLKSIDRYDEGRLSGFTAHCDIGKYDGLKVNGTKEYAHEDFCLPETVTELIDGDFCKTNRKPYDAVVVACLCILNHYLGPYIKINSDGTRDDWLTGYSLVVLLTDIEDIKIPKSI